MSLGTVVRLGYALVVVSILLMVWASLAGAREAEQYPPCPFNPLCSCSKAVPDLGIVACRDVPLPRLPPPLNASKVFMLSMDNTGLRTLDPYFLQATGLYHLSVVRNPLPQISDEAFQGLERTLWLLELRHNRLGEVPSKALRHLQKLRLLDLTGNEISEVTAESWRGLEGSLQLLHLKDNCITSLPPSAFATLPLLETLDLSGNLLARIEDNTFRDGPPRLARLHLADNMLPFMPYKALSQLRQLRWLDMSRNRLTSLLSQDPEEPSPTRLALDALWLDHNQIQYLPPGAFQHFDIVNRTSLDGNPLVLMQMDAFRNTRVRELSAVGCQLNELPPGALSGLESMLTRLDLSANNLTDLPQRLLRDFDFLRTLSLRDNNIKEPVAPAEGFQYSLYRLDISGEQMGLTSLQELRRMRNLRALSLTKLSQPSLSPEDFLEFGVDLEEFRVRDSNLQTIKAHAFMHARGLTVLDLGDNHITSIEGEAFSEIGHSLTELRLSRALSSTMQNMPHDALKPLLALRWLDLSNNRLRQLPETSFHFLRRLERLHLHDNQIGQLHKGTFQGSLHTELREVTMSFNSLDSIGTHSFLDLHALRLLRLDDNKINRVERRAFVNLERLERLDMRGNKIAYIADEAFQNLPELHDLDLAYNKLTSLDFMMLDQVGTLSSLCLNVSHNSMQFLEPHSPRDMSAHAHVKMLDFSYNNISRVGRGFLAPTQVSLTHLMMAHNQLRNTSRAVFGDLPHLQWLDLAYNYITELEFDSFRNTKRLQVLKLSHNQLADIPAEIFRSLNALRVVYLDRNRLRSLPDSLFMDEGLEVLDVSHNSLTRLPVSSMSQPAAATLCELLLAHNSISALQGHDVLARFKSLTRLDMSYNRLLRLEDASFSTMPHLASLDLSNNPELLLDPRGRSLLGLELSLLELGLKNISLGTVPDMQLPSLRWLDLSHNSLSSLPTDLSTNLTELYHLDVSHNDLPTVPHSLGALRWFDLSYNPISVLSNSSFTGARLQHLDISSLPLGYFEIGAIGHLTALRTLHVSPYPQVEHFNIPEVLYNNYGLKNLHLQVDEDQSLRDTMLGNLPHKVSNISIGGHGFKSLPDHFLQGVRSPELHFRMRNTSLPSVQRAVFSRMSWVQNITVDVRSNALSNLANPSTGDEPGQPRRAFLRHLQIADNRWSCDCEIGWVEMWQRKRHQYMCRDAFDDACFGALDDLREASCHNKNNASLLEILKNDIECGWGTGSVAAPGVVSLLVALVVSIFFAMF